jgi:hypothetical protein
VHHILFDVDHYGGARAHLCRKGYAEAASGNWYGHPYSYFDTQKSLACIAEIWSPPATLADLPAPDGT